MSNIIIGEGTKINGYKKFAASKDSHIIIGKHCAIANGCKIITLNHDYNFPAIQGTFYKSFFDDKHPGELTTPPNKERTKGHVIVGNDVWIGEDVFICSGIKIGDGCCIGARSVVTNDLPPYHICVGVPCKPIKKRYSENIIQFLLNLKWWDWDNNKIKQNKEFFYTNLNKVKTINDVNIR